MINGFLSKLFNPKLKIPQELLDSIRELEVLFGYRFKDKNLIVQALKHRSYVAGTSEDRKDTNERLEFLGDSVLNFLVGRYFYEKYDDKDEGYLTKMRSVLVSGDNLSDTARKIGLGKYVLISTFEEKTGGRDKDSILEDCMEAMIGAAFLDGGMERTYRVVKKLILDRSEEIFENRKHLNFKSGLLELAQSLGYDPPTYETVKCEGPEHEKIFTVSVTVNGKNLAEGKAASKKKAEQEASAKALDILSGLTNEQRSDN